MVKKTVGRRRGRILAFQALFAWDFFEAPYAHDELLSLLCEFPWFTGAKKAELKKASDRFAFARLLFLGAVEHIADIDKLISEHLINWDISRITFVDRAILRISTYTLLFQKDIPPTVVIDEAVSIAKEFGTKDSFKFVNAVLDNIRKAVFREA